MQDRIKQEKINRYAESFTSVVLETSFRQQQHIDGPGILKLTPVRQVNLFIIRDLMAAWTRETERLRSPYFDFTSPAVKEALGIFKNVLSNHIAIGKPDLETLLRKAVRDTLLLILSPYDYYADVLDSGGQGTVSLALLKAQVRHMCVNKAPLEKLLARLELRKSSQLVNGREAFAVLDEVLENAGFSPEDPGEHLKSFSSIRPISLADFADVPKNKSISPNPEKPVEPISPKQPLPVQISLYDELEKEVRPTLADDFQKQKIGKLRDHLTINQKFMYTKILFNGDFELFGKAIERLDMMDNLAQADRYIEMNYPEWDRTSEEYEDFRQMLERRFR